MKRVPVGVFAVVRALLFAFPAAAQITGSINGTVNDNTGAV